jgi:hypothetical protein
MNMVHLQIDIPSDVYNNVIQQNKGINWNDYIVDIIKHKLNIRTNSITDSLIEGYKASNLEDSQIISDFSISDLENWE